MNEYVVHANGKEKAVTLSPLRATRVLARCVRAEMRDCRIERRLRVRGETK